MLVPMSGAADPVMLGSDKRQFTIRACLGRGGFGEVYRASMTNATGLEADVALKVLHNDLDIDSQAVQRLRDEGRMLGALVHPAIVRVYDLVILEGRVGLVTEYVEGADLSDCIRGASPMPPRAVTAVIGRVADALNAAWETPAPGTDRPLHLIHRDVKPANIRIGVEGAVKLLDFGVARSSRVNREAHTNTGHMVGSYLYMAPECLQENEFSRASDIFALGVTLYEALAGERLFPDQSLRELYVLVLKEDAYETYLDQRLSLIDVPGPLEQLLRDMLSKAAIDRPTAPDVSRRCEDLVDTMSGPTLRRWCKARDWPSASAIPGMLDGRTITEATMAATLRPDFAVAPPSRRRGVSWGTVAAGAGGVSLLLSVIVASLAVVVVVVAWLGFSRGGGVRVIRAPVSPPILEVETGGFLLPGRSEKGRTQPAPTPSPPPRAISYSRLRFTIRPKADSAKGRLRGNGRTYGNLERIPYGSYQLEVDWGDGWDRKQEVTVRSSETAITCNQITRSCS